jgi:hypothetical protein
MQAPILIDIGLISITFFPLNIATLEEFFKGHVADPFSFVAAPYNI